MQDVTGVSRSGCVRKKSSKSMDFEFSDDIETRYRRTPENAVNHNVSQLFRSEDQDKVIIKEEGGTASEGESNYHENTPGPAVWEVPVKRESDSSSDEQGTPRTPANSVYTMEKSVKKEWIVKGNVVRRAKARKDKGKTRITGYMMWAKEARNDLLQKHPDMDFSAVSKRLGEMWANVNSNERHVWKRKAEEHALTQNVSNIIWNAKKPRSGQVGRPPSNRAPKQPPASTSQAVVVRSEPSSSISDPASSSAVGAAEVAPHLRLLGESLAVIGERL